MSSQLILNVPQYMYHSVSHTCLTPNPDNAFEQQLNELGLKGWELVSVTQVPLAALATGLPQRYQFTAFFKFTIPDEDNMELIEDDE